MVTSFNLVDFFDPKKFTYAHQLFLNISFVLKNNIIIKILFRNSFLNKIKFSDFTKR